jgi:hypothetical protein
MRRYFFGRKINNGGNLFNGHFVDVKAFYVLHFNEVACISFIGELDISKAYALIRDKYRADIKATYQHSYFDHAQAKTFFNNTILVLTNRRMIEIAGHYCQILHTPARYDWARKLMNELAELRKVNETPEPVHVKVIGFARETSLN